MYVFVYGGVGSGRLALHDQGQKSRQDAAAGAQGSGRPAVKREGLNWVTPPEELCKRQLRN